MSVIKVNNITSRDGTTGPVIAGIATVSTTSHLVVPVGDSLRRYVKENIVSSGLVLHLDFGNDESYVGSGTTVIDLSGSGGGPTGVATQRNDGIIWDGATFSSQSGGILNYSGIGTVGVGVNTTGKKEVLQLLNNVTYSIWYKINAGIGYTGTNLLYTREDLNRSNFGGIMIGYNANITTNTSWKLTKFGASDVFIDATVPNDSNWHNVSVVYDKSNGVFLYVDGTLSGKGTDTTDFAANTSSGIIKIGFSQYGSLYGSISQVSIYNRPLSAGEISQNFNAVRGRFGI